MNRIELDLRTRQLLSWGGCLLLGVLTGCGGTATQGTTPPPPGPTVTISQVNASNLTTTSATVTWTTDIAASSQVEYGTTTAYGSTTSLDSQLVTAHSVVLNGLVPGTVYHFRVHSKPSSGSDTAGPDGNFSTASNSGSLAIASVNANGITMSAATITWSTNLNATSQVDYGTTTSYGSSTTLDSTLVSSHSVQLSGLTSGTTYFFQVKSTTGGNSASQASSFTTSNNPPPPPSSNGVSLSGAAQTNRFVSVPRFFKQGDIPQFAQAVVNGSGILTQCDVKNRWPDGSLKFAIISFVLPSVATSGTQVTFQNQASGNNTASLTQTDMLDPSYDFDGTMQLSGAASRTISARAMLQAGHFRYWLQGPIVTAVIIEDRAGRSFDVNTDGGAGNPLHPIFEAWFYPQGRKVELGFTLENSWASSTAANSARDQSFSLVLTTGSSSPVSRLTQATFTQQAFTRWRRSYWIGSDPVPLQFNWNPSYLLTTKAYPNWDTNYQPSETALSVEYSQYSNLLASRLSIPGIDDPNGNGGIADYNQALNAAGAADWIGPASTWDIMYLLTGDPRMQTMMTQNADLAGRFQMWFREADHNAGSGKFFDAPTSGSVDTQGRVVSINARQQLTLASWPAGCSSGEAADLISSNPPNGNWTQVGDTSHMPDFAYIPYTLTGKYYYYEQLMMQAAYHIGMPIGCDQSDIGYVRQGHKGLLVSVGRNEAWFLRSIAYGAFMAVDGDPEGPYFLDKLKNNLAVLEGEHNIPQDITGTADMTWSWNWGHSTESFSQASNPSPLGFWRVADCLDGTTTCYISSGLNASVVSAGSSPWMEGFVAYSLGMIRQLGLADTSAMLNFMSPRYIHLLLDPTASPYLIEAYVYPTQLLSTHNWILNWSDFKSGYQTLPTGWLAPGSELCDHAYGFIAMSALSYMTNASSGGLTGQAAFNWYKANKPNQSSCFNDASPKWSIKPLQ